MTETTQRGKAVIVPTLHLRGGQVQRHGRWEHGATFYTGTPVAVAQRIFASGSQRIHAFLDDGPTVENRRTLEALASAGAGLIVEGGLREVSTCLALAADGCQLQIIEPALLDDPAPMSALAEKVPAPLLAVGDIGNLPSLWPRVREALTGCFVGIVFNLSYPVDVEILTALKKAIEGQGAELILRVLPPTDAGVMQKQLHSTRTLDLTTLADGEFLVEMLRFNLRGRQPDWITTVDPATKVYDKFLVETVCFIRSEALAEGTDSRVHDNVWDLAEGTRADLRLLLATLKEYTNYVLLDCPVFKPFGVFLDNTGKPGVVVAQLEGQPELGEYRQALLRGFRGQAERREVRAAGYAEHEPATMAGGAGEAPVVLIRLEHRTGVSMLVSVPYKVEGPEKVTFGEEVALRDEQRIFGVSG